MAASGGNYSVAINNSIENHPMIDKDNHPEEGGGGVFNDCGAGDRSYAVIPAAAAQTSSQQSDLIIPVKQSCTSMMKEDEEEDGGGAVVESQHRK